LLRVFDAVGAVHFLADGLDLLLKGELERVEVSDRATVRGDGE
jgi:hypothetical protein